MTAEAIARLRETLNRAVGEARDAGHSTKGITVRLVVSDDLRALLDAHAALEAAHREVTDLTGDLTPEVLMRLSDVQGYVRQGEPLRQLEEVLDALQHASHCGECAVDSWKCCEVGRLGEAILVKAGRR